ncbi:MAG: MarR family transcriptional regulator [Saprospiraceae bacterium]|nr:MAG: MarR family transcriptional regulator [Saprospiraceae bacterium]
MKIQQAIKQKKFKDEHHKAHINVLYTATWLNQQTSQALKPFNVSWQQFNILRILRGLHPEPATIKLLTERMIDKMSNASRLVEKLKQKGLVVREACGEDRRRVDIRITTLGLEVLEEASKRVEGSIELTKKSITEAEALQLSDLLDKLRS